jgi:hypothetical protein
MTVEVIELCFVYRVYAFDALSPNKMRTRAFDLDKRSMDMSSQYLRRWMGYAEEDAQLPSPYGSDAVETHLSVVGLN